MGRLADITPVNMAGYDSASQLKRTPFNGVEHGNFFNLWQLQAAIAGRWAERPSAIVTAVAQCDAYGKTRVVLLEIAD